MLRQFKSRRVYWFCPSCYQEMPDLAEILDHNRETQKHEFLSKQPIFRRLTEIVQT